LTKQRGHKIYLNQAPPMPARTIFISTCYKRTNPMPSRTQNIYQPILSDTGEAQNVFHYMVTQQILHKINLNKCWTHPFHVSKVKVDLKMCWTIHSLASDKTQITCIDQTHPLPSRTEIRSQLLLTKPLSCKQGQKMHLNLCWLNPSHACEEITYFANYDDKTPHMSARTKDVSQLVLNKSHPMPARTQIASQHGTITCTYHAIEK